jgi:hypothetical protein
MEVRDGTARPVDLRKIFRDLAWRQHIGPELSNLIDCVGVGPKGFHVAVIGAGDFWIGIPKRLRKQQRKYQSAATQDTRDLPEGGTTNPPDSSR